MSYEQILTEVHGRVGVIRLNRPEKLNSYTQQMAGEILDQVGQWNDDPAIGAIMMTGEGRAFCAGADLGGFANRAKENAEGAGEPIRRGGAGFTHAIRAAKPTIAAVNGYSVGVGLTMILPFDVRIASTRAQFSIRFIKMGPDARTRLDAAPLADRRAGERHRHVPDRPHGRCRRSASHRPRLGRDGAGRTVRDRAGQGDRNRRQPDRAVMMIKELLNKNPLDPDLEAVMEREGLRDQIARRLPDHTEAVTAFMEKRPPRFNG